MGHNEQINSNVVQESVSRTGKTEAGKQLGIFFLICLPVTWIIMGIGYIWVEDGIMTPAANLLITLSCFVPAVAAVLTCLITKESLWKLRFLPNLKGNGKVYLMAIFIGVFLSVADVLVLVAFFPDKAYFHEATTEIMVVFSFLSMLALAFQQFWIGMGEELGWMGYLYPRLEKLCGTTLALIATGVIRGLWHIVMLWQWENAASGLLTLILSNILLGSVLVLVTKVSKSVIPASLIHVMTNVLPGALLPYMIIDESVYSKGINSMDAVTMLPGVVAGVICYILLMCRNKTGKEQ